MNQDVRAFAWFLAGVTVVSLPFFLFATDSQAARFAKVTATVAVLVLVVTAVGLLGVQRGLATLTVSAAGLAAVAAALQLAQTGRGTNILGGNASTFSFLLTLAIGWGGIAWRLRQAARPLVTD